MGKRQDNLWLRVKAAENKVSAGLKYVQRSCGWRRAIRW